MFCPKCGTENPENGRFCRSCGTDLSGVASVVSGELINLRQKPELLTRKGKPINWESAIVKLFSGLAFLGVTIALAISQTGRGWWFWMLIPAFSALGSGIAQIIQIKKSEKNNLAFASQESRIPILQKSESLNLPPDQTDYIKPQTSIYDTDELVVPSSVTENTTRHLEINKEGETMTLPNVKEK
jgi:zinc-ribbon domain